MDSARAWAVRPNPCHINRMHEFLAHGMVAIGWPGLGDLTGVDRDEIRRRLEPQPYTGGDPRKIGRQSGELDRFVNEMTAADFVVDQLRASSQKRSSTTVLADSFRRI